ncbi:MAG: pitrilysin family protein [Bacteroidota bacterium]
MPHYLLDRSHSPVTVDLAGLPNEGAVFGYDLIKPQYQKLSNGIPIYFVNSGKHELVRIELLFDAGTYYQTKKLTAFFTNRMLREGTSKHTAQQLAEIVEFYGAYLSVNTDKDRASVSMLMLEKQIPHLLPLLGEIIHDPAFPEHELDILKSRQQQEFQVNMQKVSYLASRHFSAMVFGEKHPYGKMHNAADYKHIEMADLSSYYSQYYTPSSCMILVSGKAVKGMYEKIDRIFGTKDWTDSIKKKQAVHEFSPAAEKKAFISKPDAVQSAIRVGKTTIDHHHPDYIGLKILNTLFGGYFGSRLMKNIREDKGYTYGISSILLPLEKTGCWVVAADVNAGNSQDTVDQVFHEMEQLCAKKVSTSELNLVKNYMLGNFIRSVDGPFDLADKFKNQLLLGLGEDYFETYIQSLKAATPDTMQSLAKEYLQPESFYELIAGKKSVSKT